MSRNTSVPTVDEHRGQDLRPSAVHSERELIRALSLRDLTVGSDRSQEVREILELRAQPLGPHFVVSEPLGKLGRWRKSPSSSSPNPCARWPLG
jgi:hypothetical protein